MIKWTTPSIKIQFEEDVLVNYKQIAITFKSGLDNEITKFDTDDGVSITENTIELSLTQLETSQLKGNTEVQVNVYYIDGVRGATNIMYCDFTKNLLPKEMEINDG